MFTYVDYTQTILIYNIIIKNIKKQYFILHFMLSSIFNTPTDTAFPVRFY